MFSSARNFFVETFGDVLTLIKQVIPSYFDIVVGLSTYTLYKMVNYYPWNLYHKAVGTRKRKEKVGNTQESIDEIKKIEKYLYYGAFGAHFVSTLAVYGFAKYTEEKIIRGRTSVVFLLKAIQMPFQDYIQNQRRKVDHLSNFIEKNKINEKQVLNNQIYQVESMLNDLKNKNNTAERVLDSEERFFKTDLENIKKKEDEEREKYEKVTKTIENEMKVLKSSAESYLKQVKV